jgi:hypothetical protein
LGVFLLTHLFDALEKLDQFDDEYSLDSQTLLFYLLRQSSVPFFQWIESWLEVSREAYPIRSINQKLSDVDPFDEFFIQTNGNQYLVNVKLIKLKRNYCFPSFLPVEDAEKLFYIGRWWKLIKDASIVYSDNCIASRWILDCTTLER